MALPGTISALFHGRLLQLQQVFELKGASHLHLRPPGPAATLLLPHQRVTLLHERPWERLHFPRLPRRRQSMATTPEDPALLEQRLEPRARDLRRQVVTERPAARLHRHGLGHGERHPRDDVPRGVRHQYSAPRELPHASRGEVRDRHEAKIPRDLPWPALLRVEWRGRVPKLELVPGDAQRTGRDCCDLMQPPDQQHGPGEGAGAWSAL